MRRTIIVIFLSLIFFGVYSIFNPPGEKYKAYNEYVATLDLFDVDGENLYYYDSKKGKKNILLIHGIPTNSWLWRDLAEKLEQKDYRVIAPDLIGFGNSSVPEDISHFNFEKQAEKLVLLLKKLNIEKTELVVHDMGGLVAWNVLNLAPKEITKLHILNTVLYEDFFLPQKNFSKNNILDTGFLALYKTPLVGRFMIYMTFKNGLIKNNLSKSDLAGYYKSTTRNPKAIYEFFIRSKEIKSNLPKYRQYIKKSGVPINVIWGSKDIFLSVKTIKPLQQDFSLEKEQITILENGKHFIMLENTDEVFRAITSY